jgi:hypothetical protein
MARHDAFPNRRGLGEEPVVWRGDGKPSPYNL